MNTHAGIMHSNSSTAEHKLTRSFLTQSVLPLPVIMASDLEFTPEGVAADVNIDLEGLVDEMSAAKLEFDRFANSHEAALAAREAAFRDSVATFEGEHVKR